MYEELVKNKLTDYVQRMMPFVTDEEIAGLQSLNKEINGRIELDELTRNVKWKPVRFEFSNMFSYGENNVINFDKVNGLMGLFAPNAAGKSSLFDAISFCLFDKCSRAYKAASVMNNRKQDFHCQLDFTIDGVMYHIHHYLGRLLVEYNIVQGLILLSLILQH